MASDFDKKLISIVDMTRQVRELRENLAKLDFTGVGGVFPVEDQLLAEIYSLANKLSEILQELRLRKDRDMDDHRGGSHE